MPGRNGSAKRVTRFVEKITASQQSVAGHSAEAVDDERAAERARMHVSGEGMCGREDASCSRECEQCINASAFHAMQEPGAATDEQTEERQSHRHCQIHDASVLESCRP
jgi:hypothetical protein